MSLITRLIGAYRVRVVEGTFKVNGVDAKGLCDPNTREAVIRDTGQPRPQLAVDAFKTGFVAGASAVLVPLGDVNRGEHLPLDPTGRLSHP
jgi:hypothetical protein